MMLVERLFLVRAFDMARKSPESHLNFIYLPVFVAKDGEVVTHHSITIDKQSDLS